MAVKDVFRPGATNPTDPKNVKGKGEEDPLEAAQRFTKQMAASAIVESEVVKSKASATKAQAEAEEAKTKAERAKRGEEEPSKAGFKVTGGVDLGHLDLAKEREEASAELKRLKEEADDSARAVGQENQQLREKIHGQEMKVLEVTLKTQIEQLGEMIKGNALKGTFMDQYNTAMEMAKTLGFNRPTTGGDLTTQIELKKLDFEQTRELKKLSREERMSDRKWQLELRRLDDEREAKKQELAQQAKRDDMVAKAPQYIGGAIAQGLLANQGKGRRVTEEAATETKIPTGKHVEVGWGESGEVECPGCNQPVAIGPTARMAVCANCGERVPIRRTGEKPARAEE